MSIHSVSNLLEKAIKEKYAVGHFDVHNLEWMQAVLEAAQETSSPVILGITEEAIEYFGGFLVPYDLTMVLIKEMNITVPVALHLDHGSSVGNCKLAIDAGFTSVMIDASERPLNENIKTTKEVVSYAHPKGISVEAEIGSIAGNEGGVEIKEPTYAKLSDCSELVVATDIDLLAPALGTAHGPYKGEPKVDFGKMKDISESIKIPLVMHGASGLHDQQIKSAIASGTAKINVNADNHIAYTDKVRQLLEEDPNMFDAKIYSKKGLHAVKNTVINKMKLFGSSGKA